MRPSRVVVEERPRRRWLWAAVPLAALVGALLGWWVVAWHADEVRAATVATSATVPSRAGAGSAATAATAPYSAAGAQARAAQLALWRGRLERAEESLRAYQEHTRYPHTSRPAAEQGDQMFPNLPVVEEHPLREPKGRTAEGVTLRTSQERVFVQGDESVRFTLALVDAQGQAQPLRVLHATAREVTAPAVASLYPVLPVVFNDDGSNGDGAAGDLEFSSLLQPAVQGFAGLAGQIRLEVFMEYRGERGFAYFDIYVTPDPPAVWRGDVREALEGGSLNFHLGATVREPGRYVVSGRVDDAAGRPFALLGFNDEVGRGETEFRLSLFGKLVRDAQPTFPLTLRDVVAFRLREEGHPDRALMPRRDGTVHVSARHAVNAFSDAPWSSEERSRYVAELSRDVEEARQRVDQLTAPGSQPP